GSEKQLRNLTKIYMGEPQLDITANEKNGQLSGSGTLSFQIPPGGTVKMETNAESGEVTVSMKAEENIKISGHQEFDVSGSVSDHLKNGNVTGKLSLTYKPSDNVSISFDHNFDKNGA